MRDYYEIIFIAIIVLFFIWQIFESKARGAMGESIVSMILSSLPKDEYRLLNNIMLETDRGTTQIDHILVSVYGIFVIETKNYKGWITGSEHGEQWTKNMYGKKYKFFNPLRQNYGHIKNLQAKLNLPEDYFISIIAFSGEATIKVKTNQNVVYFSQLKKTIGKYTEKRIPQNQLDILANYIASLNVDSHDNRKKHVAQIHDTVSNKKVVAIQKCPRCGGTLKLRNGKNGKFFGCSNYPKCRFTRDA